MDYTLTTPCAECPFLKKNAASYGKRRLTEFARGEFPCHKTAKMVVDEDDGESKYVPTDDSLHCAGALIYHEKRSTTTQMMRICERLGMYDHTKLNMEADVC